MTSGKPKRPSYSQVTSTLALLLALAGGVAIAAEKIGPKGIARDAVRAKHIKDGHVRGAEVREESLRFRCPGGLEPAGDVCFTEVSESGVGFEAAQAACLDDGMRLPAPGEARLIHRALTPPLSSAGLWTDNPLGTTATIVFRTAGGELNDVAVVTSSLTRFACVRAPVRLSG